MLFTKNFVTKANQFRKQNWSAPSIMAAFIIVCMIIIFSFESIGLAKKEKNLDFRHVTTPEKIIIAAAHDIKSSINNNSSDLCSNSLETEQFIKDKIKIISEKTKEENMQQMTKILVDGAQLQTNYEKVLIKLKQNALINEHEFCDV